VRNEALRLLGAHALPKRIVEYKDGVKSETCGCRLGRASLARHFPVFERERKISYEDCHSL
jgi:hypothetical protein